MELTSQEIDATLKIEVLKKEILLLKSYIEILLKYANISEALKEQLKKELGI